MSTQRSSPRAASQTGPSASSHWAGNAISASSVLVMPHPYHPQRPRRETGYQFREDFVMDSSAAQAAFGVKPAPWEEIVAETVPPR